MVSLEELKANNASTVILVITTWDPGRSAAPQLLQFIFVLRDNRLLSHLLYAGGVKWSPRTPSSIYFRMEEIASHLVVRTFSIG
jgi:hypothetical protein